VLQLAGGCLMSSCRATMGHSSLPGGQLQLIGTETSILAARGDNASLTLKPHVIFWID
jgi:hypothetical protein